VTRYTAVTSALLLRYFEDFPVTAHFDVFLNTWLEAQRKTIGSSSSRRSLLTRLTFVRMALPEVSSSPCTCWAISSNDAEFRLAINSTKVARVAKKLSQKPS